MTIHPLFDPNSRYRQATTESIWIDGGRSTVRRFFQDRARQQLREEWMFEVPSNAQDLGYSDETNLALYESSKRLHDAARTTAPAEPILQRMKAGPKLSSPALLVLDLINVDMDSAPKQFRFPDRGAETFTGFAPRQLKELKESDRFEMDLWLEPYRHAVVLSLSPTRMKHLADVLEVPELSTEDGVVSLVQQALAPETLTDTKRQPGQSSRASRLFDVLRLVPTLEGLTNRDGRLKTMVDLGRSCPTVERDTWVIACQGPSIAV
jgi:hypothetical protein